MTDTDLARDLIEEAFPIAAGRNVKTVLGQVFDALKRRERTLPRDVLAARDRQWTERRVRSVWERTARRVDHYEIQDLTAVAVEEAKRERERLRAKEARLATLIAAQEASGDQQGDLGMGRRSGGLDHARGRGTDADPDFDQRNGWGR